MQPLYKCPFCQSNISTDDVSVATDLALCRSCDRTSAFSIISGSAEISLDILEKPPRSIKTEENFRGGKTIIYRKLSPILFFLIPFAAFWSGLSMYGIYGSQLIKGEFDLAASLFGLPFLFGTIIMLTAILFLLLGGWKITLSRGAGTVFVGVGSLGWTRYFTYDRETLVSMRATKVRVNNVYQKGILIRNGEADFVFGSTLKSDAKQFIAAAIIKEIGEVR